MKVSEEPFNSLTTDMTHYLIVKVTEELGSWNTDQGRIDADQVCCSVGQNNSDWTISWAFILKIATL
jgi:hypothetical protein